MSELLSKVKENLILEHSADEGLLEHFITAAISYAESYQHISEGYYKENTMPATTEQAVIMLASHFYESEMAPPAVSLQIMFRPDNRSGASKSVTSPGPRLEGVI